MESESHTDSRDVHIREMKRTDMPEVLSMSQKSIAPWMEKEFLQHLRQSNCIGIVAEVGDKVVGYLLYELHKHKLQIVNLGIAPARGLI